MAPDTSRDGAYVLSHAAVAELLRGVSLRDFSLELVAAIEATYGDRYLRSIQRDGWKQQQLDTLEVMGCQSVDYTCVKVISSNPSIASAELPAVTGTLICTEVGGDQARLVCDTSVLTPFRTAAGTAVVLKRVKPNPKSLGIVGAGLEGVAHALLLALIFRDIRHIVFSDTDQRRSEAVIDEVVALLKRDDDSIEVDVSSCAVDDLRGISECDVIVTATYGTESPCHLDEKLVAKTCAVIAAVGADLEGKRELADPIYREARFVADDLGQSLRQGELQYAAPLLGVTDAEVTEQTTHGGRMVDGRIVGVEDLLARPRSFRGRNEPITVYDSTGFSGQDLAVARVMIKLCEARGLQRVSWNPVSTQSFVEALIDPSRIAAR